MGFAAKEQPVPEPPAKRGFQRRNRRLFQPFITRRAAGKASQFTKIASRGDHERSVASHLSRHHCLPFVGGGETAHEYRVISTLPLAPGRQHSAREPRSSTPETVIWIEHGNLGISSAQFIRHRQAGNAGL